MTGLEGSTSGRCICCNRVSAFLDSKGRCGSPKCFQFEPEKRCYGCDSTEHSKCELELGAAIQYGSDGLPEGA